MMGGWKGHIFKYCRQRKGDRLNEDKWDEKHDILIPVMTKINMVIGDAEWWIDTSATPHFFSDKNIFPSYKLVGKYMNMYMGNSFMAKLIGKGFIEPHFTCRNTILLKEVLHVPDVKKNLVSGAMPSKYTLRMLFELEEFILTKNGLCRKRLSCFKNV